MTFVEQVLSLGCQADWLLSMKIRLGSFRRPDGADRYVTLRSAILGEHANLRS